MLAPMDTPDDQSAVGLSEGEDPQRWTLIRDAAVFQVKLLADALRDFLLSPVSLVLAVADLIRPGSGRFYRLMHLGRRSDQWIDLFGAGRRADPRGPDDLGIDEVMARVEKALRALYGALSLSLSIYLSLFLSLSLWIKSNVKR